MDSEAWGLGSWEKVLGACCPPAARLLPPVAPFTGPNQHPLRTSSRNLGPWKLQGLMLDGWMAGLQPERLTGLLADWLTGLIGGEVF